MDLEYFQAWRLYIDVGAIQSNQLMGTIDEIGGRTNYSRSFSRDIRLEIYFYLQADKLKR